MTDKMNSQNDLENRFLYLKLYEKYKNFLTQNQKQIFELYFFQDLSLREVANELATSRSAVFDSLKNTKQKLKNIDLKFEKKN